MWQSWQFALNMFLKSLQCEINFGWLFVAWLADLWTVCHQPPATFLLLTLCFRCTALSSTSWQCSFGSLDKWYPLTNPFFWVDSLLMFVHRYHAKQNARMKTKMKEKKATSANFVQILATLSDLVVQPNMEAKLSNTGHSELSTAWWPCLPILHGTR